MISVAIPAPRSVASTLDNFSLEDLESALAERRTAQIRALRIRRDDVAREIKEIDAQLAIARGGGPRQMDPAHVTAVEARIESDDQLAGPSENSIASIVAESRPRPRIPIGFLALKALAAAYPSPMTPAQLAEQLKANSASDRLEATIHQSLGRLAASGYAIAWEDGGFSLTTDGMRRAGAG